MTRRAISTVALAACAVPFPGRATNEMYAAAAAQQKTRDKLASVAAFPSSVKQQLEDERERKLRIRSSVMKSDQYIPAPPPPPPPPPALPRANWKGEYEVDGETRYTNPYAQRMAEVSKDGIVGGRYQTPALPSAPVRRDGFLSVKPNNLRCDAAGRNCKFIGPAASAYNLDNIRPDADEVPDGKILREDLELLRGGL